jgi:hypothetical protein
MMKITLLPTYQMRVSSPVDIMTRLVWNMSLNDVNNSINSGQSSSLKELMRTKVMSLADIVLIVLIQMNQSYFPALENTLCT